MSTQLTAPPAEFTAGTSVTYRRDYPDYPASLWTLSLHLAGVGVLHKDAGKDGDTHVLALLPADSASLGAGTYQWWEQATSLDQSQVVDLAAGRTTIRMNPRTATAGSGQSWAEKALAAVRARIAGDVSAGIASFQLFGRAVSHYTMTELYQLEKDLSTRVAGQRKRNPAGRSILASFTKTGG